MGHFDPNKTSRENARLRAKVRAGAEGGPAGRRLSGGGGDVPGRPAPASEQLGRARAVQYLMLPLLSRHATQPTWVRGRQRPRPSGPRPGRSCAGGAAGDGADRSPNSAHHLPRALQEPQQTARAAHLLCVPFQSRPQVQELQQMVVKFEPMAYKDMRLRFTRVRGGGRRGGGLAAVCTERASGARRAPQGRGAALNRGWGALACTLPPASPTCARVWPPSCLPPCCRRRRRGA